jgi:hypothetical protein
MTARAALFGSESDDQIGIAPQRDLLGAAQQKRNAAGALIGNIVVTVSLGAARCRKTVRSICRRTFRLYRSL